MRLPSIVLLTAILSACSDDEPAARCHFASGRPCDLGEICLGVRGNECNYAYCQPPADLVSTAVACSADTVAPTGAVHDCDPASVAIYPPPAPCPLGSLHAIVDGTWGPCVPVSECLPLACDPAFAGDGCPSDHRCDVATHRCVAA